MTFNFGATAWFSDTFSLEDSIKIVSGLEYEGVEIAGMTDYFDPERRDSIKQSLKQNDVELISVSAGVPFSRNPLSLNLHSSNSEVREASVRYVCDCVDLAARLDGRLVYVTSVLRDTDRKDSIGRFIESLRKCADYAETNGLLLALEDFPFGEIPDVYVASDVLAKVNRSNTGLVLDTGHLALSIGSLEIPSRLVSDSVIHIHVNNNDGSGDKHWPPSIGKLTRESMQAFLRRLRESGYNKYVSVELLSANDPERLLRDSRAYLLDLI